MNNILITGGSGTLGRQLVRRLYPDCGRIVVYSRDEQKHAAMSKEFSDPENKIRYIIGDVRDYDRLHSAIHGIDTVIHTAAMKHIDRCAYNPDEAIGINVQGTLNVCRACVSGGVTHAWFISTDKACGAISLYGASKAVSEHAWISYNNMGRTAFNVVRYGNVIASKGSVLNYWKDLADAGQPIPVTDDRMTRFFWKIQDSVDFLLDCMHDAAENGERGCLYIAKMERFKLIELARKFSANIAITGMRCPEKIHEDLILQAEAISCYDLGRYYVIYPLLHEWARNIKPRGVKVGEGFRLTSEVTNETPSN